MFSLPPYDPHVAAHHTVTTPQLTLLLLWLPAVLLWILHLPKALSSNAPDDSQQSDPEAGKAAGQNGDVQQVGDKVVEEGPSVAEAGGAQTKQFSVAPDTPTYTQFLTYMLVLGTVLLYFYLCDFYKVHPN